MLDESDVSVLTVVDVKVVGVKSAKQLNSSAEYDVVDDDVEGGLVVWPGTNNNDPEVRVG